MLKIKKIVSAFIIPSLILLMAAACAELDSHSDISRFQRSENLYISSMRWGEWSSYLYLIRPKPITAQSKKIITITDPSTAKKYKVIENQTNNYGDATEQRSSTNKKPSREELLLHLETIKVSHTEVLNSSLNEAEGTAESRMLIQYRFDNSAKIKTLRYNVSWWRDKESNSWFSESPMPKEFEPPKHKTIKLSPKRN